MRQIRRMSNPGTPVIAALLVMGLQWGAVGTVGRAAPPGDPLAAGAVAPASVALLDLQPAEAVVGQEITVAGSGFAPGMPVALLWETFDGHWELVRNERGEYAGTSLGPRFTPAVQPLLEQPVTADQAGRFTARIRVPEDYGGVHNVLALPASQLPAARAQPEAAVGWALTQAGVRVMPTISYSPQSGPVGTPIRITIRGLNSPHEIEGWYQLLYDNRLTGSISAVTTRGTAVVTIPATGGVGLHYIDIQNGPFGSPYRALESSPYAYLPVFRLTFRLTAGKPVLPPPPSQQLPAVQRGVEPSGAGPAIWFDPTSGPVGQPTTVHGRGFAPHAKVSLVIYGQYGSRVTAAGFQPVSRSLLVAQTDAAGRIEQSLSMPDTHGGYHRIGAQVGEAEIASTGISIDRTPVYFGPDTPAGEKPGPVYPQVELGEELRLHLKGIGWTETENIFAIVYDNSFIGYSCGFSTFGDVVTRLTATGQPGWHFIELYPSFYRNERYAEAVEAPFLYRFPLLSWQDHPHPFVLRYAFEIKGEAADRPAGAD